MTVSWMTDPNDPVVKMQREAREAAVAREKAHRENVALFTKMYLSLGADAITIASGRHDGALLEARALAGHRWSKLFDLEGEAKRSGLPELVSEAKAERKRLEALRTDYGKEKK